ncbi:hypothetical protein, partial [Vibrio parahaemolyticus]
MATTQEDTAVTIDVLP